MSKLRYHLVDVFTNQAFSGNQLAVFPDASDVSEELMQKLALELSLSQTTFVLPPARPENDFQVRIFTTATEISFAGHPTIGTTFVLAHEKKVKLKSPQTEVKLEEGIGIVPVTIDSANGEIGMIRMTQDLPRFGSEFTDMFSLAELFSLNVAALDSRHRPQVVGCGIPFLYVAVKTLDILRNIKFRLDVWHRLLKGWEACCVMTFTTQTVHKTSSVHCRMFAPGLGVMEDAATGAANGPLGCYLVKRGIIPCEEKVTIISEQGFEMGRPSIITIEITKTDGKISSVVVGGECVYIGEGYINI